MMETKGQNIILKFHVILNDCRLGNYKCYVPKRFQGAEDEIGLNCTDTI